MKKTDWYPRSIDPVRPGPYEVQIREAPVPPLTGAWYSWWTGRHWTMAAYTIERVLQYKDAGPTHWTITAWRGLAEDPATPKLTTVTATHAFTVQDTDADGTKRDFMAILWSDGDYGLRIEMDNTSPTRLRFSRRGLEMLLAVAEEAVDNMLAHPLLGTGKKLRPC